MNTSAVKEACAANSQEQQPGSEFLEALFSGIAADGIHVLSLPGDPNQSKNWHGGRLGSNYRLNPDENLFYSIAAMDRGSIGRSVATVSQHVAVVFDDVGTKVPLARLEALELAGFRPLAKIETSQGNQQWVFKLASPVNEDGGEACRVVAYVREFLKANDWGDRACFDPARYMRLPAGINGKSQHAAPDGSPWRVRALEFNPAAKVDLYRLAEHLLGPDFLVKATSGAVVSGSSSHSSNGTPNRNASMDDPYIKLAAAAGLNPRPSSRVGVIECDCPNHVVHGVHSNGQPGGFDFIGAGTAKCHHEHCQDLDSVDFRELIMGLYDARAALGQVLSASSARHFLAREAFENAPLEPAQAAALATAAQQFSLAPVQPFSQATIPPRQWLYGRSIVRGYISMVVAPGGVGKSALTMVEAVAMATGRELLTGERPIQPLRVWCHNAEDDSLELQRRLAATLLHHKLSHSDLNNNLVLSSGRELPICLARDGRSGPEIVRRSVDNMVQEAKRLAVDVIVLDPLGALHTLPENSNEAVNLLMGALREIADRAGVAIVLVHHTSKTAAMDMDAAGAGAARGASALVDAARNVRQLARMSPKDAPRLGIPEHQRRDYLRVENGKSNLARAEGARWLRLVGVSLNNGSGLYPQGDTVQTVEQWAPPTATLGSPTDLLKLQREIAQALVPPRWSDKSPEWAGYIVASVTGLDIGEPGSTVADREPIQNAAREQVRAMLTAWKREGGLVVTRYHDGRAGRTIEIVEVGKVPLGANAADDEDAPGWA